MDDPARTSLPQSVTLPPKQFLTEDQLLEIWETRGLKFRVDEFYDWCTKMGLLPHCRREIFRGKFHGMMEAFLVRGDSRRDPKAIPPRKLPKLF
jgi:hypothetical protein